VNVAARNAVRACEPLQVLALLAQHGQFALRGGKCTA
jgi:hypothetical protein